MKTFGVATLLSAIVLAGGRTWGADTAAPAATPPSATQAPDAATPAPPKPPFSVLFAPDEFQAINQAFADHDHPSAAQIAAQQQAAAVVSAAIEAQQPHIPNIYVSAILDFGGGDWTVWANGLRITPDQQSPLFKVVAVRGNTVDISVTSDGGTRISLQPYQTWRSRQRDVVEGIAP